MLSVQFEPPLATSTQDAPTPGLDNLMPDDVYYKQKPLMQAASPTATLHLKPSLRTVQFLGRF